MTRPKQDSNGDSDNRAKQNETKKLLTDPKNHVPKDARENPILKFEFIVYLSTFIINILLNRL